MQNRKKLILATALMCGTAVPAAWAQDTRQTAQNRAGCERLMELVEENRDRFRDRWLRTAEQVAGRDNAQQCSRYAAQAEEAARELDAREAQNRAGDSRQGERDEDGNRIVVTQPQPEVTVDRSAPEIAVQQQQPNVTVRQGQPEIVVNQRQPTVRVQMPQPTITINQPQPEIIVRMPEPQVGVALAEPEIEVSQPRPQVRVEQAEPRVAVTEESDADINVQSDEPIVRLSGGEQQARVEVSRGEPQVSYNRAEPNVEFEMTGEPRVRFNSEGEPQVRVERMGDDRQSAAAQQATEGQQQASVANRQRSGVDADERTASLQGDEDRMARNRELLGGADPNERVGQARAVRVGDVVDREVINRRGDELGTVERIVRQSDQVLVVVSHGGLLGIGEDEVVIPLERFSIRVGDDRLLMRGMSEEDLDELPDRNTRGFRTIRENDTVQITSAQS